MNTQTLRPPIAVGYCELFRGQARAHGRLRPAHADQRLAFAPQAGGGVFVQRPAGEEAKRGAYYGPQGMSEARGRVSDALVAGRSQNSYRGLVQMGPRARNARNFSQCDSLLMTDTSGAHTFPYIESKHPTAQVEHEATTSRIGEDQIFYCLQRGLTEEQAIGLIVNGYAKEVLNKLPMEFAVEARKLLTISLEGSVG